MKAFGKTLPDTLRGRRLSRRSDTLQGRRPGRLPGTPPSTLAGRLPSMLLGKLTRRLALATAATMLLATAPAQAYPQWLSPQTVSLPGQDTRAQQVAVDQGGDTVVVWQGAGAHMEILASARMAGGSFSVPQTLSDPTQNATLPDVAIDAHGDALAVWLQFDGANERVQSAYRPAGGSFGPAQTLSAGGYDAGEPRAAMDGAGEAAIVWSLRSGVTTKIQAALAGPGGGFDAPVDLTGFTADESVPQIALDAHGSAIAVWDGSDGANIRIEESSRPAGGGFGAPQFLSQAGYNADTPQVAFDTGGDALAVWRFDGSPASTVQGAYQPVGGTFGSVQTVSTASSHPAQRPQVAFDGHSEGVVAWQQEDGSDPRVQASVRSAGVSGAFSPPSAIDSGGQEALEPQVAGDGQSSVIVSWKTFNGIASSTQAAVRPAGGSFGSVTTVSPAGAEESTPEVGIDAQGDGIAVWTRFAAANYMLEAALYDDGGPLLHGPMQAGTVGAGGNGVAGGGGTSPSPASCTLSASRNQKLLGKGAIRASIDCNGSIEAILSGRLIVAVPDAHARQGKRGRGAKGSTSRSYALLGADAQLVSGHSTTVQLTVPSKALHAVLAALHKRRRVGLSLSLRGAPGSSTFARTQIPSIANPSSAHVRGGSGSAGRHG
jgi:hypothetical protein